MLEDGMVAPRPLTHINTLRPMPPLLWLCLTSVLMPERKLINYDEVRHLSVEKLEVFLPCLLQIGASSTILSHHIS